MADKSSHAPLGRMNRRRMLGTTTALVGGAVAGIAGNAFGQQKPTAAASALTEQELEQVQGGRMPARRAIGDPGI